MWFLDLGFHTFVYFMCVFFAAALVCGLKEYGMRGFRQVAAFFIAFLVAVVICCFKYTNYNKNGEKQYPQLVNEVTLGEMWCNYTEYNSELCKDYVEYVLIDKPNLAEQKRLKREKELEKEQMIDEKSAKRDRVRTNYQNLVKDITNTKDTQ